MMYLRHRVFPCTLVLILTAIASLKCLGSPQDAKAPKLVLLIVVDQMRADHLTRFAGVYRHGFARLLQKGAVFTNAHHDHAGTVTAAGHATISSGYFPSHHGIVGNEWFDRTENKKVYCAEDTTAPLLGYSHLPARNGRSPNRFLRTTFGDWLKEKYPQAKVFGVARKDRAAIMTTGAKADGAYWYNHDNGNMMTSEYYRKSYPVWVEDFNKSRAVDRYFKDGWTKLMPEETYFLAREDTFPGEGDGKKTAFPYPFESPSGKPDTAYYGHLAGTPFVDQLTIEFAKQLIANEGLGTDDSPDLLAIGCSAADGIGHTYGPLSQESMDHFLRLDFYLGELFDFLDDRIGERNYLVVLSSDHGVLPMPEELARRGYDSKRVSGRALLGTVQRIISEVGTSLRIRGPILERFSGGLFLNYAAAEKAGVGADKLDEALATELRKVDGLEDVFTKKELTGEPINGRPYQARFAHSFHPERAGDLMVRFQQYYLRRTHGTSHGSPYNYDSHVPIVFSGPGFKKGIYSETIRTVDVAPTLAKLLGLAAPADLDGQILQKAFRSDTN